MVIMPIWFIIANKTKFILIFKVTIDHLQIRKRPNENTESQ